MNVGIAEDSGWNSRFTWRRATASSVELTPLEYDLLVCLLRRGGAVVDRETLLTEVWGYKAPVPTRTIDTHIGNLRAKLEDDPSDPRHLVTVRKGIQAGPLGGSATCWAPTC